MTKTEIEVLYEKFAALPFDEQRRATTALPPDTRAALWVFHLQAALNDRVELTDEQRAIIAENIDLLSAPDFFRKNEAGAEHEATRLAFEALKTRAKAVFSDDLLYGLFFRLGRTTGMGSDPISV